MSLSNIPHKDKSNRVSPFLNKKKDPVSLSTTTTQLPQPLRRKKTRLPLPLMSRKMSSLLSKLIDEVEATELTQKQENRIQELMQQTEQFGIPHALELKDLGDPVGHGIFLREDTTQIKKGELVGVYTGKYLFYTPDKSQLDFRYLFGVHGPVELTKEEILYHFPDKRDPNSGLKLSSKDEIHIGCDAREMGNFTRLINQGAKGHINCEAECVIVHDSKGKPMVLIGIFTSKTIHPGDQLFLDYGDEYWEELGIQPFALKNPRKRASKAGSI